MFDEQSILVTGGAGSFGRDFVRNLLRRHAPRRVVVFSRDEFKQFEMRNEMGSRVLQFVLGDVRDRDRLVEAMRGIDLVVHAAALKQVLAAEQNPMECIKTNIHGAENVISASLANDVKRVVALSTDKAASPVSLYGATKLAADRLFVAANNIAGQHPTLFSVVRYGNVVGSRGSVLPLFRAQLAAGKDELPITDLRMTRFWITSDEAVSFVSAAFQRMQGGEIFVPRLPSVRIEDLARSLDESVSLREIGIRPGEKLHEMMCPEADSHHTLEFADHFVIYPNTENSEREVDYTRNLLGEIGKPVDPGFEFCSNSNERFLTVEQLREINRQS
ncbi:MAG: UDP-N-acetylglucosamine 4,6-dehydratase (inverting) [Acidobacteriota bacterium]|nr:UDP-N-acetylglucosamine 4,6-dehydratase (inverting) [Acidobacteriota bacterium]MDH3784944.1 UDP-N-acetylglucosamine 4,6-dehydratase (inverting) [Acidobacteriota bacterium]